MTSSANRPAAESFQGSSSTCLAPRKFMSRQVLRSAYSLFWERALLSVRLDNGAGRLVDKDWQRCWVCSGQVRFPDREMGRASVSSLDNSESRFGSGGCLRGSQGLGRLPGSELGAHCVSTQAKQGAYIHKRKYVFGVVGENPRLRFSKALLLPRFSRVQSCLKRPYGIKQERFQ